jgi:hypothetical protein
VEVALVIKVPVASMPCTVRRGLLLYLQVLKDAGCMHQYFGEPTRFSGTYL